MTKRQDGDKHLGFLRLACHLINDFTPVTGKINIHLVCGIVFDMTDNLDVKLILADCPFERRQLPEEKHLISSMLHRTPLLTRRK